MEKREDEEKGKGRERREREKGLCLWEIFYIHIYQYWCGLLTVV